MEYGPKAHTAYPCKVDLSAFIPWIRRSRLAIANELPKSDSNEGAK